MRWRGSISILVLTVAAASLLTNACNKKDVERGPTPVSFEVPAGFPQPAYDFSGNPLTKEGIALGRQLFYDGILSKDGNVPCGSCHQQFAAFATFDHDLSHGVDNAFTTRNAQALSNLAWQKTFHHDGGILNLETQPLAPLTATNEMGETVAGVIAKLKASNKYQQAFREAFGEGEINSQKMLKALTQFMVTLVSANSKYDKVKRGAASFTIAEQAGYATFKAKCASCHQEPLFTDGSFRNNGIGINPFLNDGGRIRITRNAADSLRFQVPSLRNVDLSFPYMHDGRFYTLQQVLTHYRTGVQKTPNLDPSLQFGIGMTNTEASNVLAFLKTLTDSAFVKDPRFAAP